jgi:IS5 family transposase
MGQLGFFDADKRLQALSARGDPLEAIDHLVPWESFRAEIEAVVLTPDELKKSSAGRKPFDAILMFRMLVLQALNNLSDEQVEYQVRDRLSFSRFLGLAIEDSIPDATTLWLFREKLARAGLIEQLFDRFDQHLAAKGSMARGGQIIDASIVPVPTQRNSRDENAELQAGRTPAGWKQKPAKVRQKDRDARWTKKHGRSFFGYKNHVNADAKHKLIRHYAVTDAAVHDSQELEGLLDRATPAMMCSPTALIGRPRSRPNSGPVLTTVGFIDAVGATIRCLWRKCERTTPRAEYALASSMCSERSRTRRAVGSCERSASCGRAPRSACRTWPTTFAVW